MVLIVLLVLALFVLQTLLPGRFREPAAGPVARAAAENLGQPRSHAAADGGGAARHARLANMHEALPVFLALALLNMILGTAAGTAITGATVFLIARVFYVPALPRRHPRGAHADLGGELGRPGDDDRCRCSSKI